MLDGGGGATTMGGGERGAAQYPAVPLPLLSGSGPQAIPDFLTLTDEANERAGGLQPLRSGAVLTWDDVSAQLQRPQGVPLVEDADGAEALGAAAGGGVKGRGCMMWRRRRRRLWRRRGREDGVVWGPRRGS